jgi:hypothetical protein
MRLFSLIVCTITFVYGIITIFFIAFNLSGAGLFERITIIAFMMWLMVASMQYVKKDSYNKNKL